MKSNFEYQLDSLIEKATEVIAKLIQKKGVKSDHTSSKCLKVTEDAFNYNLDGGRWLTEISEDCLTDNNGYQYDYSVLETSEFMMLVDYLTAKY